MTQDGFRRLALSLPEATEVGHMGHPDFRMRGKIFKGATNVRLEPAKTASVRMGLVLAWRNVAPQSLAASVGMTDGPDVSTKGWTMAARPKASRKGKRD